MRPLPHDECVKHTQYTPVSFATTATEAGKRHSASVTHFGSFWVKLSDCEAAFPRVSTVQVKVWLLRFTHILGILGNGIIHSIIAGVRFLQRARMLNF